MVRGRVYLPGADLLKRACARHHRIRVRNHHHYPNEVRSKSLLCTKSKFVEKSAKFFKKDVQNARHTRRLVPFLRCGLFAQ